MDFRSVHSKFSRQDSRRSSFCVGFFEIININSFETLCSSSGFSSADHHDDYLDHVMVEFLRQIILCFCSSGKTSNDGEHSFSSVIIPNISLLAPLLSRNHFHFYVCSLEQSSLYTSKYFNIHYLQFYYSSKFSAIIPHYFSPGPSWPLSKSLSLSLSLSSAIIPNISLLALLSQNHFHFHVFLGYYPQHFSSGHSLSKSLSLSCLL